MRPKGSAEVSEARRHRALALVKRGLSLNEIARKLGCATSSVMR
jgi:DNA-binding CsgD family transcriptional regulator